MSRMLPPTFSASYWWSRLDRILLYIELQGLEQIFLVGGQIRLDLRR